MSLSTDTDDHECCDDDVPVDALDALYEDLAMYASKNPDSVIFEADRLWSISMVQKTHRWLAGLRRNLVMDEGPPAPVPDIRSQFLEMSREELIAALEQRAGEAGIRIVHPNLNHLSDSDLRRFVETLESQRSQS